MRLPIAALTTAAAALPSVAAIANLNKEERTAKKTIFHKDGFNGKQTESINNMLTQYHAYSPKRNKESSSVIDEESAPKKETTLDHEVLSARRTITKDVEAIQSSTAEKETIGADDAATDAEVQNDQYRGARKERRDRKYERRAAAQKDDGQQTESVVADIPNKERRGGMRELQPEPRKPNPRPLPIEAPNKEGKPTRRRSGDLRDRRLKKSKRDSYQSSSWSGGSGSEDTCIVHMTNLTPRQEFSDIFVMTHSDKLYPPLFEYGKPAFDDLAALAQDGDTDELVWYYDGPYGDDHVYWVSEERGPIRPGESISFGIDASGSYDQLTLATSFIFSNDGFVAINGEEIYDGAEFWLWGIDAGVEANTQLCWTVQASGNQFPYQADCYNDRDANLNDNSILGVGYVHVHSGIHDLDGKADAKDFLSFSCDDLNANNFAEYFYEIGFDDDLLLRLDDDREFLDYLEDNDDLQSELDDIINFAQKARTFIEPYLFDFRTPMMKVELEC
eukprot:scaffold33714_cov211-Skeletonema_dohrnii-CCMP3373.AAC.4